MAIIDPGPDAPAHVRAVASAVEGADRVSILLTHGHGDHAGAVPALVRMLGVDVWGPGGLEGVDHVVSDGDGVDTDAGALVAVATPGHTRDHLCFHQPSRRALFAGDFLLGRGDTTWVAEYPGCIADYLASLARLRTLDLGVVYPAHGPPLLDPADALDRFEAHRRTRIRQVRDVLEADPDAELEGVMAAVYGDRIPEQMKGAVRKSLDALIQHVRGVGR